MNDFVRVPESDWQDIVDATREKTGGTEKLLSGEVAAAVRGISTGTPVNNQDKTVTQNGTYTADEGYTGLGMVTVDIPDPIIPEPVVEPLTVTENGTYTPLEGIDGYNPVTVNVASSGGSEMEELLIRAIERDVNKPVTKLPAEIKSIGNYVFYNYTDLTLTSLPAGVARIDQYAFFGCTNLALTSLPAELTSIGDTAFQSCKNLALTSLPAGITSIGNSVFNGCTKLTEITFEGTPTSISTSAFKNCKNLLTINVPWAEGEVANAPWGATNATINYNYTGG